MPICCPKVFFDVNDFWQQGQFNSSLFANVQHLYPKSSFALIKFDFKVCSLTNDKAFFKIKMGKEKTHANGTKS